MNTVRIAFLISQTSFDNVLVNPKNGKPAGLISKETYECVQAHAQTLDSTIIYNRDFSYN